jgi:hypothetical protein
VIGGHGHVRRRLDGLVARCGGPGLCRSCAQELAALQVPIGDALIIAPAVLEALAESTRSLFDPDPAQAARARAILLEPIGDLEG